MATQNIQLGRIWGIPVDLDRSWFLIFILMSWLLATSFYPDMFASWPPVLYWVMGAITAVGLFASVLLHELGHSAVARGYGMPVLGITLFLFGGVARLGADAPNPRAEFLISLAGPLVSLVLAILFFLLQPLAAFSEPVAGLMWYLAFINLSLFIFNLIPGYPLDGGQMLRALLWAVMRDRRRATFIAASAGRVFGLLFIAYGVLGFITSGASSLWTVLIGWFLYAVATQAARHAKLNINDGPQ
jgi:Zn-dependent protease